LALSALSAVASKMVPVVMSWYAATPKQYTFIHFSSIVVVVVVVVVGCRLCSMVDRVAADAWRSSISPVNRQHSAGKTQQTRIARIYKPHSHRLLFVASMCRVV
jgi:hypothetical protein